MYWQCIIDDSKMVKNNMSYTAIHNGKYFEHFGIHPSTAMLYGHKTEEIVNVDVIISSDQGPVKNNLDVDYWGWWSNKDERFTFIFPKYFLLNMCFPYGMKVLEERNEGKAYRVEVNPIDMFKKFEGSEILKPLKENS